MYDCMESHWKCEMHATLSGYGCSMMRDCSGVPNTCKWSKSREDFPIGAAESEHRSSRLLRVHLCRRQRESPQLSKGCRSSALGSG